MLLPQTQTPQKNTPDPNAMAGSPNSLGEESRRDGRPATDDTVVEAIDEEGPEVLNTGSEASD